MRLSYECTAPAANHAQAQAGFGVAHEIVPGVCPRVLGHIQPKNLSSPELSAPSSAVIDIGNGQVQFFRRLLQTKRC
jgi:hypothetical protein